MQRGFTFWLRPRRFGKSLLISTLEGLFRGHRDLFQGLWIDASDYDWETYPVRHFDFSQEPSKTADDLKDSIRAYLSDIASNHGLDLPEGPYYRQFRRLIQWLAQEKQMIILIDEYDKPLIDNLENLQEAKNIRDTLKGFYGVSKAMEGHIRLAFITGISKFSRVGVFSDINNLIDLTLDERFANLLGPFRPSSRSLASINYWFESGTPPFLIKLLHERNYDIEQLNGLQVDELAFSTYELERLAIGPLLSQTGYLTIKDYDPKRQTYQLHYSNHEVENAFLIYQLDTFSNIEQGLSSSHLWRLIKALQEHD